MLPQRLNCLFCLLKLSLLTLCLIQVDAAEPLSPTGKLEQRPSWTNLRLNGFPDPLPPYRTIRTHAHIDHSGLLAVGAFPAKDRMWLVTHREGYAGPGTIYAWDDQGDSAPEQLLQIPEIIYGLAFHPQFANNGLVFIGCNGQSEQLNQVATKVLQVTIEPQAPYRFDKDSLKLVIEWPSNGHNGGDLAFANDGMLYVTAGDGTSDSDTNLTGQDLTNINGSVIRIDVDHPSGEKPYRVPGDNPFIKVAGAQPEIWAFGLRNPWRMTYDSLSDQLWVGNNGQDLWETAHLIRKGENYGWSVYEGSHPFHPKRKLGPAPLTPPTVEHHHSEARSLTGGVVYRGQHFPELVGAYVYGDYATGNIWAVLHDTQQVQWQRLIARSTLQIAGFGADTRGELLVVDHAGGLYRLEPQPPAATDRPFPTLLSQTELFADLKAGAMQSGLIPYAVQAPLWSDGASKSRWLAVPDHQQIEFTERWGWNFPAGSVLVKTFSLPVVLGEQVVEKRIETRIMTKVDKEWFGYSYRWNDQQSDATLVGSAGADETLLVSSTVDSSQRTRLTWHYPSRNECMVCHSRAANYVLGLSTEQMNRLHDYGGHSENQIAALARVGILKMPEPAKEPDQLPQLADPSDESQPLEKRARAYLHANCAHCHTSAGGGNARIELSSHTALAEMHLLDSTAQHDTFQITDAKLIAPGSPDRSLLLQRMSRRGPGQMPPLASGLPDASAIELMQRWIIHQNQP